MPSYQAFYNDKLYQFECSADTAQAVQEHRLKHNIEPEDQTAQNLLVPRIPRHFICADAGVLRVLECGPETAQYLNEHKLWDACVRAH